MRGRGKGRRVRCSAGVRCGRGAVKRGGGWLRGDPNTRSSYWQHAPPLKGYSLLHTPVHRRPHTHTCKAQLPTPCLSARASPRGAVVPSPHRRITARVDATREAPRPRFPSPAPPHTLHLPFPLLASQRSRARLIGVEAQSPLQTKGAYAPRRARRPRTSICACTRQIHRPPPQETRPTPRLLDLLHAAFRSRHSRRSEKTGFSFT